MAGTGRAPKPKDERRNRVAPRRGEWVDLAPLKGPVLPTLPRRTKKEGGPWPARTRAAWNAWRRDPVTAQYGPADVAFAIDTIHLHAAMTPQTANEVRLRMDALGLTPKGKRDLRWRVVEGVLEEPPDEKPAPRGRRRAHLVAVA